MLDGGIIITDVLLSVCVLTEWWDWRCEDHWGLLRSTEVHVTLTESENQPGLVSGQTGGPASTQRERERERERDWDWVWLHHNLHFSRTCRACRAHSLHWHSPLSLSTVDYLLSTSTNISYSCLHHLDLLPHWQWEILLFFFRFSLVLHIDYQELSHSV